MLRTGLVARVGIWLRKYAVALALVLGLLCSIAYVNLLGAPPMPQQPPIGYTTERNRAVLQWNKGTRDKDITLQVSVGDPDFGKPLLMEKVIAGNSQTINKLQRGKTYYWRLIQLGKPGPTSSFKVSKYNVRF